jgi:hypothetical protein
MNLILIKEFYRRLMLRNKTNNPLPKEIIPLLLQMQPRLVVIRIVQVLAETTLTIRVNLKQMNKHTK